MPSGKRTDARKTRGATVDIARHFQALLRDAEWGVRFNRGINPTSAFTASLRDGRTKDETAMRARLGKGTRAGWVGMWGRGLQVVSQISLANLPPPFLQMTRMAAAMLNGNHPDLLVMHAIVNAVKPEALHRRTANIREAHSVNHGIAG